MIETRKIRKLRESMGHTYEFLTGVYNSRQYLDYLDVFKVTSGNLDEAIDEWYDNYLECGGFEEYITELYGPNHNWTPDKIEKFLAGNNGLDYACTEGASDCEPWYRGRSLYFLMRLKEDGHIKEYGSLPGVSFNFTDEEREVIKACANSIDLYSWKIPGYTRRPRKKKNEEKNEEKEVVFQPGDSRGVILDAITKRLSNTRESISSKKRPERNGRLSEARRIRELTTHEYRFIICDGNGAASRGEEEDNFFEEKVKASNLKDAVIKIFPDLVYCGGQSFEDYMNDYYGDDPDRPEFETGEEILDWIEGNADITGGDPWLEGYAVDGRIVKSPRYMKDIISDCGYTRKEAEVEFDVDLDFWGVDFYDEDEEDQ